jgi:diguanylate cyclase (GGDEF)-like protein
MKLRYKMGLAVFGFAVVLAVLLVAISSSLIRAYTIHGSTQYANTVAEMVRTALTESMLDGTTPTLPRLKARLAETAGLSGLSVDRAPAIIDQYGAGPAGSPHLDGISAEVIETGRPAYELERDAVHPVFRATIPYIADSRGDPNCLTCHQVPEGTVLGAVTIRIGVGDILARATWASLTLGAIILLFVPILLYLFNRLYRPIVRAAEEVETAVARAGDGDFTSRVKTQGSDEASRIGAGLNRLLDLLEGGLSRISDQIARLVQYDRPTSGHLLTETTRAVDELVDAAQFKQAIEEDETKAEVYARLSEVMQEKLGFERFSIYEVDEAKNKLAPTVVDGVQGAENRWCDAQILVRSEACRARRTGHPVNAFDQPGICTMFGGKHTDPELEHVCLPVLQSGGVGSVVQVVAPAADKQHVDEQLANLSVHLREASPVLEAKRLMETLRESSMRDAMTGLYNRRFLEEYLDTLIASVTRNKLHLGILMLDLDYFKKVNDTYGHEAGDKVLIELARVIRQCMRASDLTVRFGGEEFLVILNDTDADGAMVLAEKVRASVEEMRVQITGGAIQKTISIGVSDFPADGENFWQVLKYADVALYAAKENGRNRVERFVPEMWSGKEGEY